MLTSDLKKSLRPKDVERYDTLCDVNISCMAAVDILNDLLCYDKLGSGSLELHKEEIIVESYVQSSLSMFTAQANESGVTSGAAPFCYEAPPTWKLSDREGTDRSSRGR